MESKLYKPIEKFLKKEFNCNPVRQRVGDKYGKVDVMGVRQASGDFASWEELIAVEVKEQGDTFLKAIGQAFAYSIYAHRCYLAINKTYNKKFSEEEKEIATQLGIGLIEIRAKGCKEVLTSKCFTPHEKRVLHVLDKLSCFKCSVCRGIYPKNDICKINPQRPIDLTVKKKYIGRLKKAVMEGKNAKYYLYEMNKFINDGRKYVYYNRFICKDCVSLFASLASE